MSGFDKFKSIIKKIETGNLKDPFIRTQLAQGSSAYGPYQVTKGLALDYIDNDKLTKQQKTALKEMVTRQMVSLQIGGSDRVKYEEGGEKYEKGKDFAKHYGYCCNTSFLNDFDYGGTLGYPEQWKGLLTSAQEAILRVIYEACDCDPLEAAAVWHGGRGWRTGKHRAQTDDYRMKYSTLASA